MTLHADSCNACGAKGKALVKLSLGKDFFGRPYDRLSPSSDQSPKWYCEVCSMHKNLQRDFRDILAEYERVRSGQPSELTRSDEMQRAQLRLREITAILDGHPGTSPFLQMVDVKGLMGQLQAQLNRPA